LKSANRGEGITNHKRGREIIEMGGQHQGKNSVKTWATVVGGLKAGVVYGGERY